MLYCIFLHWVLIKNVLTSYDSQSIKFHLHLLIQKLIWRTQRFVGATPWGHFQQIHGKTMNTGLIDNALTSNDSQSIIFHLHLLMQKLIWKTLRFVGATPWGHFQQVHGETINNGLISNGLTSYDSQRIIFYLHLLMQKLIWKTQRFVGATLRRHFQQIHGKTINTGLINIALTSYGSRSIIIHLHLLMQKLIWKTQRFDGATPCGHFQQIHGKTINNGLNDNALTSYDSQTIIFHLHLLIKKLIWKT